MKKLMLLIAILFIPLFSVTACNRNNDDSLPPIPEGIVEAPFEDPFFIDTQLPGTEGFNWADLFDDDYEDEVEMEYALGLDPGGDGLDDFVFDFGEHAIPPVLPDLEEAPPAMILEYGIPLDVTNPDLLGLQPHVPGEIIPIIADDVPDLETGFESDFEEDIELDKTNDPLTATALGFVGLSLAGVFFVLTKRNVKVRE